MPAGRGRLPRRGVRLDGREPEGRLEPARSLANETINLRLPITDVDEIDDDVTRWIDEAWEANL